MPRPPVNLKHGMIHWSDEKRKIKRTKTKRKVWYGNLKGGNIVEE